MLHRLPRPEIQFSGVVNMDMIAWDSNNDNICNIHTADVGITHEIYDKMVELNSQYNIGLDIVEVYPQQPYSDHASFHRERLFRSTAY